MQVIVIVQRISDCAGNIQGMYTRREHVAEQHLRGEKNMQAARYQNDRGVYRMTEVNPERTQRRRHE